MLLAVAGGGSAMGCLELDFSAPPPLPVVEEEEEEEEVVVAVKEDWMLLLPSNFLYSESNGFCFPGRIGVLGVVSTTPSSFLCS